MHTHEKTRTLTQGPVFVILFLKRVYSTSQIPALESAFQIRTSFVT
jgi:hypothetical protein